jgi:hypothetical protein
MAGQLRMYWHLRLVIGSKVGNWLVYIVYRAYLAITALLHSLLVIHLV